MPSVLQPWVHEISMMQQSVLLSAIRGPDGRAKYNCPKMLLRFYRRSFLVSSLNKVIYNDPVSVGGGSFTGPSIDFAQASEMAMALLPDGETAVKYWPHLMQKLIDEYFREADALPSQFQDHFMHGAEILGYKHPDAKVRSFWHDFYVRLVKDKHLKPETEAELNLRLGDDEAAWRSLNEKATQA